MKRVIRRTDDDLQQQPDRATSDEMGRTGSSGRPLEASPREQPAKAVRRTGTRASRSAFQDVERPARSRDAKNKKSRVF